MTGRRKPRTPTALAEPGPDRPLTDAPDTRRRAAEVTARLGHMWRSIRDGMRDIEAAVPDDYRFGTSPDEVYQGQCFWQAYIYAQMHYPRHGFLYAYGEAALGALFGVGLHAWVELPGEVVFDGTLQRFYRRPAYYERQHARPYYLFTAEAAGRVFVELDDRLGKVVWYWDHFLGLPWSHPGDPPLRIDLAEAERRMATSPRMPPPRKPKRRRPAAGRSPA